MQQTCLSPDLWNLTGSTVVLLHRERQDGGAGGGRGGGANRLARSRGRTMFSARSYGGRVTLNTTFGGLKHTSACCHTAVLRVQDKTDTQGGSEAATPPELGRGADHEAYRWWRSVWGWKQTPAG